DTDIETRSGTQAGLGDLADQDEVGVFDGFFQFGLGILRLSGGLKASLEQGSKESGENRVAVHAHLLHSTSIGFLPGILPRATRPRKNARKAQEGVQLFLDNTQRERIHLPSHHSYEILATRDCNAFVAKWVTPSQPRPRAG